MSSLTYHYNQIKRKRTFDVSALVCAYYYPFKPKFEAQWEKYDFSQIFLILEGEGTYKTETATYRFSPGMMIYRPAGRSSIYMWDEGMNVRFGILSFVCDSTAMDAFADAPLSLFEEERISLLDLIKTTTRVCEPIKKSQTMIGMQFKPDTPEVALDFLSASIERFLCMLYCRISEIELLIDESQKANKYIDEAKLIERVICFLEEHIEEQLTVARICTEFGISQTTLMKKFRHETNQGVMDYFMERKIDEAKLRIRKTTGSFSEIAEALGFSSANYFSRVFKAKEGMTPTEYSKFVSKRNATGSV